jgi:hypothetical protein
MNALSRKVVLSSSLGIVFLLSHSLASAQSYPLKKSANGRYLVDQNNLPFLIAGDAPQSLMVNVSTADADLFFANRKSHGFNAVWINLLCNTYTAGRPDSSTYDGIVPFTTPNDFSTPNETYFARCDQMINMAANHGLVVFLDPAETGSFLSVMHSNGTAKCRSYGQFLGNRYKNFNNIVWMSGNDYQTWSNASDDAVVTAVALGIRDNDTRHIHTIELSYLVSLSLDDPNWAPIISLNAAYTYSSTYAEVLKGYNSPGFDPVFMVEANYEGESLRGFLTTPYICRKQEYWTNLSGATGQLFGNHFSWTFASGWKNNLDTAGAIQMAYLQALFTPRAWYNLVPDQNHTVLTAGLGTFDASGSDQTNDYATAARTPDGSLVMAYLPTLRTVTLNMTQLSGPVTAQWYDPSNGTYTAISGSPFSNTGTRNFSSPGNNHAGDGDWVLVLEASSTPAPPTITSQPASQTVGAGQTATFRVGASGTAPLSYQWRKNGATVGTNAPSYTTPATAAADNGARYDVVVSNALGSATSNAATLSVTSSGPLPPPWLSLDLGNVGLAGGATYSGAFTLKGSGADIWGTSDAFQYVYQSIAGDGYIVARVTSVGNTDPWAKAGVMIRETLTAGSRQAMMVLTPGNGAAFQRRVSTNGASTHTPGGAASAPLWVKVNRTGSTFSGYRSPDGLTWTLVGSDTISMANSAFIGLAVTSHNNSLVCTASLDNVSVHTSAVTVHMGETTVLSADDSGNANLLLAQAATLGQSATLESLSFYVTAASGKLRLGVYDATGPGGGPGAKKAETAEITPGLGWNTAAVTAPVALAAGSYWLAYLPSDNNLHFRADRGTGTIAYYPFAYGTMASTFSTSPTRATAHWSFYATLTVP